MMSAPATEARNIQTAKRPNPARLLGRILVAALLLPISLQAMAGAAEIPDDVNARIARVKSQIGTQRGAQARGVEREQNGAAAIGGAAGGGSNAGIINDGCTIAIGNVLQDDSGIGTSARKETTVIITGDVIQAGNNCR